MSIKAVTLDAYGTLLRNDGLSLLPARIVADHGLSVSADEVLRTWIDLYHEATQSRSATSRERSWHACSES